MRVLMTADCVGGVWSYALDLIKALRPYQVQVALATMGAPLSANQRQQAQRLEVDLFESKFKLEWMDSPWAEVEAAGAWLVQLAAQVQPDLVHLNGYAHAALHWPCPRLVVGHSCVLSWWQAVKGESAPLEWNRYREIVRAGLHAADMVVAPSAAMLTALEQHYGRLPRTEFIYNGCDATSWQPGVKEPLILAAGRLWDEAKNIALLEAVAERVPWSIKVAGAAQHPAGGSAAHRGVELLGVLAPEQLAGWFGRAAIYALPARYEPFGLSVLEAACAGCALVLGDIASLREIWGAAALYVAPDQPDALREALERLIADDDLRRDLAQQGRRRALYLSAARMAARYMTLYRQLCQAEQASILLEQSLGA